MAADTSAKDESVTLKTTNLSLYDDSTHATLAAYLEEGEPEPTRTHEQAHVKQQHKARLGTMLGVYLPTIQNVFGVQMFLRLVWLVGVGGMVESFIMVFLCCLCTFLTSISISAIATNGVISSGGAYFMISRNLGPEFGGAVGVLYYLANVIATALYLTGGVEIVLVYIFPEIQLFGNGRLDHGNEVDLYNNIRFYASVLLVIKTLVVAAGVKFVQYFAPLSLACVIVSIFSVYIGSFLSSPARSPMVCMLGDVLLKPVAFTSENNTVVCDKSVPDGPLWSTFCANDTCHPYFLAHNVSYVAGIPGYSIKNLLENMWHIYLKYGEALPDLQPNHNAIITQDMATSFFVIMAIFFPAVTGIFTGANMSGDLKDPQKSLPIGTITAQVTTSFVFLSFVVVYSGCIRGALMRDKYGESLGGNMIVGEMVWPTKWVFLIGAFTSTFGAGVQSLCTAPRLLQSIAQDDVLPCLRMFSKLTKHNEPFRALIISSIIAEISVLMGSVDYIAPVMDFFFLMCYFSVNLACALQTLLKAPNWRPRYRYYHWSLSCMGSLLCLFIMFFTYWYYAIVVLLMCAFIHQCIAYKGAKKEWGDGMRGLALSAAQFSLLSIEEGPLHPKNWRPQLLILLDSSESEHSANAKLLQIASQLKAGQGLTVVATLVEVDISQKKWHQWVEQLRQHYKMLMRKYDVRGFVNVVVCRRVAENVGTLIQSVGLGGLRPNTVMVNWPARWREEHTSDYWDFLDAVHRAATMDVCLLISKNISNFPNDTEQVEGNIDVWWVMHDGGLLILLPFLMKQHKTWSKCNLRVFAVAQKSDNMQKMKTALQEWVYKLRIDAVVDVIEFAESSISAYVHGRASMVEQRDQIAKEYKLSRAEMRHEPQLVADRNRFHSTERVEDPNAKSDDAKESTPGGGNSEKGTANKESNTNEHLQSGNVEQSPPEMSPTVRKTNQQQQHPINDHVDPKKRRHSGHSIFTFSPSMNMKDHGGADAKNLRKLHSAVNLNRAILQRSSNSELVVINLPRPPRQRDGLGNYMHYLDALTNKLKRVLLVRGTRKEVITIYS